MPRIQRQAVETAMQKILDKIENYKLTSGDIVSDSELAQEFEMSRTPVREAIMILIQNGLLERNRTKVVVSNITLNDIIEILDVRDAIERKAIELIVNHGGLNQEQITHLNSIQKEMQANIVNGNFTGNFHADHVFHLSLIEYSKNKRLETIYNQLTLQSQRLRWFAQITPERFVNSLQEHQVIIDALVQKNCLVAQEAIRQHLINTKENYHSILSSERWLNIAVEMRNMI